MSELPVQDLITEARRIIRVTSRGEKIRRVKCRKGYKLAASKQSCVPITGSDRAKKRRSIKKSIRTKRAKGASLRRRSTRKRLKAMRRRRAYGL